MAEYTYEHKMTLPNGSEVGVVFHYTWTPGRPARINYDCMDHPSEADEIELIRVDVVGEDRPYRPNDYAEWIEAAAHEYFDNDVDDIVAALIESARSENEARAEDYGEAKAEWRREHDGGY